MPEVTSATASASVATGGLTLLGIATGLDPVLLVAGLAGGFFSYYFMEPLGWQRRVWGAFIAGMGAGWGAPLVAAALGSFAWFPAAIAARPLENIIALGLGFLANPVIAPLSIKIARRRAEEASK